MNIRVRYWYEQYRQLTCDELTAERTKLVEAENRFSLMTVRYANDPIRYRDALEQTILVGERIEAADLVLAESIKEVI